VVDAFFLPTPQGARFCLLHVPPAGQPCRGTVLYIHPLAEELNRCRRMASLQARALARAGFAVLQMDLLGCGDSSGDFADATWEVWLSDVDAGRQWLTQRYEAPLWLWGVRAGCLLAAASTRRQPDVPVRLLMWQPVVAGRQHLQQFLRLRQMAEVVHGGGKVGTDALLKQLEQGQAVEVAGYAMAPGLAQGLGEATLDGLANVLRVVCLEVVAPGQTQGYAASPALAAQVQRWNSVGIAARTTGVEGEAFWQLPEAQLCTALVDATAAALVEA
jgi:exosortase A-associated hydrolase 2